MNNIMFGQFQRHSKESRLVLIKYNEANNRPFSESELVSFLSAKHEFHSFTLFTIIFLLFQHSRHKNAKNAMHLYCKPAGQQET